MKRGRAAGEDAHGNVLAFVDALFGEETTTRAYVMDPFQLWLWGPRDPRLGTPTR